MVFDIGNIVLLSKVSFREVGMQQVSISHVGLFVHDLALMREYYINVLGFIVTDEVPGRMCFLSRNIEEHHQVALFAGRTADTPQVQQLSFKLDTLEEVREVHRRLVDAGTKEMRCVSHGIAWSIYFPDPEGNRLEYFTDTEWYVKQPCADPVDFTLPADEIYRISEATNRAHEDFQPLHEWRDRFNEKLKQKILETQ
ncbi:VOC family protein [Agrobacterium vitis]|uniref:VOC family protein n=1 Tax=Agrobacterium vitis TaxID=373 RepID=UPI0012E8CD63|nr:VOC family protein [Agrobacterium vitis]MVA71909.1 ring-cleaving dioxygenase [Agrobacterium vitis]